MSELAVPLRTGPSREHGNFRVLVVDDDPDMVGLLARILEAEALRAETLSDGHSALVNILASPPDLILLDVMMPGLDGFELCSKLKKDDATALIPVVLITSLDDQQSRVRGIAAGADDFLTKPVKREELLARVRTLRRLHETRRELESRRMAAEIQRKEAIRGAFARYVSPRLADRIIHELGDGGGPFKGQARRSDMVAMFVDLRGFTRLTELSDVGAVVEMLNEYFSVLTDAVYQHDGTIFNMAGDSLLIGFNVPFPQHDAAHRAYLAAIDMVDQFASVSAQWERRFGLATGIGIGICRGDGIFGNIGSPHYMNFTIIGNPVNTAARLVQMAAAGEVLVCNAVYDAIRELVPAEAVQPRGDVTLRGKSEPVSVFNVSGRG
jgi:class 3 adenylate cyclase